MYIVIYWKFSKGRCKAYFTDREAAYNFKERVNGEIIYDKNFNRR